MRLALEMKNAKKEKPPEQDTHLTSEPILFVTSDDQVYMGFYHANGVYYAAKSPYGTAIAAVDPDLLTAGMKIAATWGFISDIRIDATIMPGHPPDCQCDICIYSRIEEEPPIECDRCGKRFKTAEGAAMDLYGRYCIPCGQIRGIL